MSPRGLVQRSGGSKTSRCGPTRLLTPFRASSGLSSSLDATWTPPPSTRRELETLAMISSGPCGTFLRERDGTWRDSSHAWMPSWSAGPCRIPTSSNQRWAAGGGPGCGTSDGYTPPCSSFLRRAPLLSNSPSFVRAGTGWRVPMRTELGGCVRHRRVAGSGAGTTGQPSAPLLTVERIEALLPALPAFVLGLLPPRGAALPQRDLCPVHPCTRCPLALFVARGRRCAHRTARRHEVMSETSRDLLGDGGIRRPPLPPPNDDVVPVGGPLR